MSTSDKRRGGSHAIRSSNSSRSSSIIAPPPRAQLTGSPSASTSAGQETESAHEPGGSSSNPVNKDGGAAATLAAREKESMLLKEKDERITALERELAVMESEFTRELDRLSQNESETASFWQRKHSALHQQFLRVDTELRLLRSEVDVREAERQELRDGWDVLRRELRARDDEILALKGHLNGMKQWVSASTRTDQQTSDEEIGESMAKLGNSLQNWVIMHFRKAKLDFSGTDQSSIDDLSQLVPMYQDIEAHAKLHLLQSIVSSILVEMVFGCYFAGLSDAQANQLRGTEQFLASIGSTEALNQWRAMTLTLLRKEAPSKLQTETAALVKSVVSRVNSILDAITGTEATEARNQALYVLVNSAVELARLLVVQKAVFKVTLPKILPHQRTTFEASSMDDIGGEEEESLAEREICCVTFPGVTKFGDENGSHPQYRNIIAKARVLCSPE
ncbi:hypothetical protein DL766_003453 [Monosporascus sp. MC13-8B]|uniref:Dilute domain-containing protein n=1 Tax=Monosporascus cannonballus TaxID=155416 RepID=A0ABY0HG55_9PEZI|nr:hypothetical protein DL762_001427 [Monosporascus cannonballus]RYP33533.1 hypothetical protein DL766_003453 [Monosporascus sp. MC13-8B]